MRALSLCRWSRRPACCVTGVSICLLVSVPAAAGEIADTLQVHGFLSQALLTSDGNDFWGESTRNVGSLEYTEMGLNVSLRPGDRLLLSAQVLSRRAGDDNEAYSPSLDYGLLDYQLVSNSQRVAGIQVGKLKQPFGLYNATRDVAFTRPSILLPQSLYFDRTRVPALSSLGVSLYSEERVPGGTLSLQAGVGRVNTDDSVGRAILPSRAPARVEGDLSALARMRFESGNGAVVAAFTMVDANIDIKSTPYLGRYGFRPAVFSLQYNREHWNLTGEYAIRRQQWVPERGPGRHETGESWYVQYTRRFAHQWQWLARYDSLVEDTGDGRRGAHASYARDGTVGLRWNVSPHFLLAAEYHNVEGTAWLPGDGRERYWDMLLFQVALRF